MYEKLKTAATFIQSVKKCSPQVGIVLGSGLGSFVEKLDKKDIIPYSEIPFFCDTTVEGHAGRLILAELNGVQLAILQGRLHGYEGHPMEEVVFPIRTLATLGIKSLILTNASGGINENFKPGDIVLIEDHINFMGKNPLVGPNPKDLGPRFPDMTHTYNQKLQEMITDIARETNYDLKSGVYVAVLGPTYETPAEVRMLRALGADMVGMSTVPEAITANHMGIEVCGLSCITNMAAGIDSKKLNHEDVKKQAHLVMESFSNFLKNIISKMASS